MAHIVSWIFGRILLLGPFCLLLAAWGLCVWKLPEKRKWLLTVGLAEGGLALVLFGGDWLLGRFGLTWRLIPREIAAAVLWCGGLWLGVLVVRATVRLVREKVRPALSPWAGAFTGVILAWAMFVGTVLGALWFLPFPGEVVGTMDGEIVVQGVFSYWDTTEKGYAAYAYHGPLVRGTAYLTESEDGLFLGGAVSSTPLIDEG